MLILGACSSVVALPLHQAGRDDLLGWVLYLGVGFTLHGLLGLIAHGILEAMTGEGAGGRGKEEVQDETKNKPYV